MKYYSQHFRTFLMAASLLGLATADLHSQDDEKAAVKADKTGTNPVNFTHDARLYNEFLWLNTKGDGEQNITTFEFRTPFADGKW